MVREVPVPWPTTVTPQVTVRLDQRAADDVLPASSVSPAPLPQPAG